VKQGPPESEAEMQEQEHTAKKPRMDPAMAETQMDFAMAETQAAMAKTQALADFIMAKHTHGRESREYAMALYNMAEANLLYLKQVPIPQESKQLQEKLREIISGKFKLNFCRQNEIIIFVDPGADWDDEIMLFFILQGIFNEKARISIVMSSGTMTSQSRLDVLSDQLPFFKGMTFNQPKFISGNSGATITIYEDGHEFLPSDTPGCILVCASVAKLTWESLVPRISPECVIVGVGFGPEGVDDGGINTKFTQQGGLYRDKNTWDAMMNGLITKGVRIYPLLAEISRHVIIEDLMMIPENFRQLVIKTHRMFAVSRPPASMSGLLCERLNGANAVLAATQIGALPEFDTKETQGAIKVMKTYDDQGASPESMMGASLAIMYAHILGAEYKPGMTGFLPTSENKELCPCLTPESSKTVSEHINQGTTPYDLLGAILMSEILRG